MSIPKIFSIIFALYIFGFLAHAGVVGKTVYGDGIYYFSWVRSIIIDRDIHFENEYAHFGVSQPISKMGLPGNKYSIGPALFWLPGYLSMYSILHGTGYELLYELALGLAGVLYTLAGLVLLYRLLTKFFTPIYSLITVLGLSLATNLYYYGALDTVNSHAVSFFASVVFLTFLYEKKKNWVWIGISLGLIALIRPQDLILGLLIIPYINPKGIVHLISAIVITFLPQLVIWQLLNGSFLLSPYLTADEGFSWVSPHFIGVLFSPESGLLFWTPIILIGIIGLWIRHKTIPIQLMGVQFLLQLYVIAAWSTWWQGASYSGRMFVGTLPLIAFGMAHFFETYVHSRFRPTILLFTITLPLCLLNFVSIVYFLATH